MTQRWSTIASLGAAAALLGGCAGEVYAPAPRPTAGFQAVGYATWRDSEPAYRLYPGDEIDVQVPSAPELSKTVTVQPDGRIALPLISPVMVADRSVEDAEAALTRAYAKALVAPQTYISVRATPLKVFVGGEVTKPGVYDMPGDINTLQAVIMAGGFTTSAKKGSVILIRRGAEGRPMLKTVDLLNGPADPRHVDLTPLRRFDVIYVPKTGVAETGDLVQQYIRNIMPASMGFSYASGGFTAF